MGLSGENLQRIGVSLAQLAKAAAYQGSIAQTPRKTDVEAEQAAKELEGVGSLGENGLPLPSGLHMPRVDLARGSGETLDSSGDSSGGASGHNGAGSLGGRLDFWA